jgi:hypothetical protein
MAIDDLLMISASLESDASALRVAAKVADKGGCAKCSVDDIRHERYKELSHQAHWREELAARIRRNVTQIQGAS